MRSRAALAVLAAGSVLTAGGMALVAVAAPPVPRPAPAAELVAAVSVPAVNTAHRADVAHLYRSVLAPALRVEPGWSGAVDGCRAGALSSAAQQATLTTVNAARRLAGLSPVHFDSALSAKAQQAALVFKAQDDLSHDIPSGWACATSGAQQAAAASNIAAGTDAGASGAGAVLAYLAERSTVNSLSVTAAAHRRWILDPVTGTMGSGSTDTTNALWVRGPKAAHPSDPAWVSWPSAGWFPSELEPAGRWSLSGAAGHTTDFSSAHVTVRTASGTKLHVEQYPVEAGFGEPTLVWQVAGLRAPSGWHARSYRVTVSGIVRDGRTVTRKWTVHLFDPMALVPGTARITRSGAVLTVHTGAFTPGATATAVRWTRGSTVVGTGARYRTTAADRGHTLVATVTGVRARYTAAAETASVHVPK